MHSGKLVFSQLMQCLPMHQLRACVARYAGRYPTLSFSHLDQFLCMAFAQLSFRESLRDIEACLRAHQSKLYHLGIRGHVARSTLADANDRRDWRIYRDFAQVLIAQAREIYRRDAFGVDLDNTVYALDSTTIDLSLSLFPWAHFTATKAAVKLHTLMDLRGNIPSFVCITHAKHSEISVLDELPIEPGSLYVMDRGYIDFKRLYAMHRAHGLFVVRARSNHVFRVRRSSAVERASGLRCDQLIRLAGKHSHADYPVPLRRVGFYDATNHVRLNLFTNHLELPALSIAQLYRCRWQIELLFKWLKQHLRIKAFFGRSPNAVRTQIWIAIAVYVLVAIVRKRLNCSASLHTILQILSVTLFEKTPLNQLLANAAVIDHGPDEDNQLKLF